METEWKREKIFLYFSSQPAMAYFLSSPKGKGAGGNLETGVQTIFYETIVYCIWLQKQRIYYIDFWWNQKKWPQLIWQLLLNTEHEG